MHLTCNKETRGSSPFEGFMEKTTTIVLDVILKVTDCVILSGETPEELSNKLSCHIKEGWMLCGETFIFTAEHPWGNKKQLLCQKLMRYGI